MLNKYSNKYQLRIGIACICVISLTLSFSFYPRIPKPELKNSIPPVLDMEKHLNEPIPVYKLSNVTVQLYKASILDKDFGKGKQHFDAVAIGAKIDLATPFNSKSLDTLIAQDRTKVFIDGREDIQKSVEKFNKYMNERTEVFTKALKNPKQYQDIKKGWWITQVCSNIVKNNLPMYFLAGIPALTEAEKKSGKLPIITPYDLSLGVKKLCKETAEDVNHLAIPLFATGAGGLSKDKAVPAILEGINKAAVKGACPKTITIILFPGKQWENAKKSRKPPTLFNNTGNLSDDGKKYLKECRDFKNLGSIFRRIINENAIVDITNPVWNVSPWAVWAWQLSLLFMAPSIGAFFVLLRQNSPIKLHWGNIIEATTIWIALALGFQYGQDLVLKIPPSKLPFFILFISGIVVPWWRWNKFGEIKKTQKTLNKTV